MINALAMLGCLLAAVEVTVSPDQPLAFSYVDDPLIVEVRSDADVIATIRILLDTGAPGDPIERTFTDTALGPDIDRWCAVKDLPERRGPWTVTVEVDAEAEREIQTTTVYRIDRPAGAYHHPLYAYGDQVDRDTLLALRAVAVRQVRIPASHENIELLLQEMVDLDMRAYIVLSDMDSAAEIATRLSTDHCDAIAGWELPVPGEISALQTALETIRALPCSPQVTIGFDDQDDVGPLMAGIPPGTVQHFVVRQTEGAPDVMDGIRDGMAAYGLESPLLEYRYAPERSDEEGGILKHYFEALAHRAHRVAFPAAWVIDGGIMQPGLAELNGLAHGVSPDALYGSLPRDGVRALMFGRGDAWTVSVWATGKETTLALPASTGTALKLFGPWYNSLDTRAPADGAITLDAAAQVRLVQGTGGEAMKTALLHQTETMVDHLLKLKSLAPAWSETTRATLTEIKKSPESEASRVHFFALLRAFPEIEERWHTGQLPRPVAVSALAHLAELSRLLCRVEAVRGANFLEPLQDTLARCEEYQSLYLTGTTTTPQARARGDWLVQEVRRLMDEVEFLLSIDARIEAGAVAALAEWRARGLEPAAKAGPLSDRMTLPEPEPAKEPEKPKEAPAKKKKGKK